MNKKYIFFDKIYLHIYNFDDVGRTKLEIGVKKDYQLTYYFYSFQQQHGQEQGGTRKGEEMTRDVFRFYFFFLFN